MSDQEPQLAGTNCPNCQTVCIYQPPLDAIKQGISTVSIACHHCEHIFETALPKLDAGLIGVEHPQQAPDQDLMISDHPSMDDEDALPRRKKKEKKQKKPKAPRAPMSLLKRLGIIGLVSIGLSGGVIGVGILLTPPVDTRSLEDQFKVKRKSDIGANQEAPAPLQEDQQEQDSVVAESTLPEKTVETTSRPEPTPAPPTEALSAAQFVSSNTSFTLAEGDLGMVMTINAVISNEGGQAGIPNDVVIYLIDADGNELMSWPLVMGKRPIQAGAKRSIATQIIEPPEGVASVEIDIK